jgi:hypothetical protein
MHRRLLVRRGMYVLFLVTFACAILFIGDLVAYANPDAAGHLLQSLIVDFLLSRLFTDSRSVKRATRVRGARIFARSNYHSPLQTIGCLPSLRH